MAAPKTYYAVSIFHTFHSSEYPIRRTAALARADERRSSHSGDGVVELGAWSWIRLRGESPAVVTPTLARRSPPLVFVIADRSW